jgi:hypothetical protein
MQFVDGLVLRRPLLPLSTMPGADQPRLLPGSLPDWIPADTNLSFNSA